MSGPEDANSPLGQLDNLFACWGIGLGEDDIETGGDGRKLIGNSVPHNNHSLSLKLLSGHVRHQRMCDQDLSVLLGHFGSSLVRHGLVKGD